MESPRKHFCKPPCLEPTCGRSTYNISSPGSFAAEVQDCINRMSSYVDNLSSFCGAGTYMTEAFANILQTTEYGETAGQFHGAMKEVNGATTCVGGQIKVKIETALKELLKKLEKNPEGCNTGCNTENIQVIAKCFLQLMRLQCQFILTSTELLSQFCDHQKIEDMVSKSPRHETENNSSNCSRSLQSLAALHLSPQRETPGLHLSPQRETAGLQLSPQQENPGLRLSPQTETVGDWNHPHIMPDIDTSADIWGQNSHLSKTGNYVGDGQVSQFGNIGSRNNNHQYSHNNDHWSSDRLHQDNYTADCGVTQEELDNVIDFLSGHAMSKHLQSIPESMSLPMPGQHVDNTGRPIDPTGAHIDHTGRPVDHMGRPIILPGKPTDIFYRNYPNIPSMTNQNVTNNGQQLSDDTEVPPRGETGSNTWPAQPRITVNNADSNIDTQNSYMPYGSATFGSDPEFLNYVASIGAMIGHNNNDNPVWSTVDLKLNKSWPLPSYHPQISVEQTPWSSTQHDSSSSDESANEEALISLAFRESAATGLPLQSDSKSESTPLHVDTDIAQPANSLIGQQPPLPPKQPWTDPSVD